MLAPEALMTLPGEVAVLLQGLGATVRQALGQSLIPERVAAEWLPSPTGREGVANC